jgi:hypothetical protein
MDITAFSPPEKSVGYVQETPLALKEKNKRIIDGNRISNAKIVFTSH